MLLHLLIIGRLILINSHFIHHLLSDNIQQVTVYLRTFILNQRKSTGGKFQELNTVFQKMMMTPFIS